MLLGKTTNFIPSNLTVHIAWETSMFVLVRALIYRDGKYHKPINIIQIFSCFEVTPEIRFYLE